MGGVCIGFCGVLKILCVSVEGKRESEKKEEEDMLRRRRVSTLPPPILSVFYRGIFESILTTCVRGLMWKLQSLKR